MATAKKEVVEIRPLEFVECKLNIVGDTSMIQHKWSEKAKRQMLESQTGTKKGKSKEAKNPVFDFVESMYWTKGKPNVDSKMKPEEIEEAFVEAVQNGARFGFPVSGIKQAAISASYRMGWSKDKASLRGVFFVDAVDELDPSNTELAVIESDAPTMREDMVRISGTTDIRYRGEFNNWSTTIKLRYNKNGNYSLENIINMINAGGVVCGLGEWRPECDGNHGMFHVEFCE